MTRRSGHYAAVASLAIGALVSLSCTPLDGRTVLSAPGTTTTIFLVRHAERNEGLDPPLNAEGLVRAEALADVLESEGVTAVFYPDLIRNRETAAPLLERIDASVRVYTALEASDTRSLANVFVNEVVANHSGGVVLWIGNTGPVTGLQEGNLQEIYARLGGIDRAPTRYQDMFRVELTEDAPPAIMAGEYGGSSSLD